jgi:hypothetical protein
MAQVSLTETADLLKKLLDERIPLLAFLRSTRGDCRLHGFVDSVTRKDGLVISVSGPPIDVERGYLRFQPFVEGCVFWYGEKRELPEQFRHLSDEYGESVLLMGFGGPEHLSLFFTL